MLQEVFAGSLIGLPGVPISQLTAAQAAAIAAIAAGFTGLLSLFNIGGRFFWASFSDYIGRKKTYYLFFLLGIALYALVPTAAEEGPKALFVGGLCVIVSMYGGGFSTLPAYLADMFGTQFVGAIHGRLLTAWSTAGIIGPVRRELCPRSTARGRRAARPALRFHHVHSLRDAGRRSGLQLPGQARRSEVAHERRGNRAFASGKQARSGGCIERFLWNWARAVRRKSGAVLGARRGACGVGRLNHAAERRADFLMSGDRAVRQSACQRERPRRRQIVSVFFARQEDAHAVRSRDRTLSRPGQLWPSRAHRSKE